MRYNSSRKQTIFNYGEWVLVDRPFRLKGRSEKLLHRFMGPYKIIKRVNNNLYVIQSLNPKKKRDTVYVSTMKRFFQRNKTTVTPVEMMKPAKTKKKITWKDQQIKDVKERPIPR